MPLVLASRSPRRHQLLELIGLSHLVDGADIDELSRDHEEAPAYAERLARAKALAVAARHRGSPVLGADTVVEVDGHILGKPGSNEEARQMLRALSGRTHQVHTAVALACHGRCESLVDSAAVDLSPISQNTVEWYVATGEPMDKAGSYAIQGIGGLFVKAVEGSPHTVVGLPIHRLEELWSRCDLDLWEHLGG